MTFFDLLGALKSYCENPVNGHIFIAHTPTDNLMANYELGTQSSDYGQHIVIAGFDENVNFGNAAKANKIDYSGSIMYGIKFDAIPGPDEGEEAATTSTEANLDETYFQKYLLRLKQLRQDLLTFIESFACDHDLKVTQCKFTDLVNFFDDNADFVSAQLTLSYNG